MLLLVHPSSVVCCQSGVKAAPLDGHVSINIPKQSFLRYQFIQTNCIVKEPLYIKVELISGNSKNGVKSKIKYMPLSLSKVKEDLLQTDNADRDQKSCSYGRTRHWNNYLSSLFPIPVEIVIIFYICVSPHKWCFIANKYLFSFFLCYTLNPYQSLMWLVTYNLYICLHVMLWLYSQNLVHHLMTAFSVLLLNISVSNGLNLISILLRNVKKNPKSQLFCTFTTVLSISTHLYCSHNGEVFIWTLYAHNGTPKIRKTWYHIIQRKEGNAQVPKSWSDWNLCTLGQ